MKIFSDRADAGRRVGALLREYYGQRPDVVVFALPRGGVPVGYEVAEELGAPLDVYVVRKLGVPGHEELAMGAIASGGVRVLNDEVVFTLGIPNQVIDAVVEREREELQRRDLLYRGDRPRIDPRGKTVILVDDGLATGSTMRAAVAALRQQNPARIVIAVPVAARATCDSLAGEVDEIFCAYTPESFFAVGAWYDDFSQTSDDDVRALLDQAHRNAAEPSSPKRAGTGENNR